MKFFKQIYCDGQFKGSRGYVLKFLKRHNIRFLKITGEKLSSNVASVDAYVANFSSTVRHKQLGASQRFNADESGLFLRARLPQHMLLTTRSRHQEVRFIKTELLSCLVVTQTVL